MKNEIKIYCKFDKTKENIEEVIGKMFLDYTENKNVKINNLQNSQNLQNDNTEV